MSVDRSFSVADATLAVTGTVEAGAPVFTMLELKERGWTEAMVRRLLGPPDATVPNPVFQSGVRIGLWRVDRVHAVQTTEEWARAVDAAHEQAEVRLRSTQRRRDEALQVLDDLPVPLPDLDRNTLILEACDHYNRSGGRKGRPSGLASPERGPAFLNRICVDYLVARIPSPRRVFGQLLDQGIRIGYIEDRRRARVLDAIRQQYP
jgi:hypothetical protein